MIRTAAIIVLMFALSARGETPIEPLIERAEAGDAAAQIKLGTLYRDGKDVERDYDAAVRWYREAVGAGSAEAMDHLGFMYLRGWGVNTDFTAARELFEKAAEGGSHQAMFNLGRVYSEGLGVAVDRRRAEVYWDRAIRAGNRHAPLASALQAWYATGEMNLTVDDRLAQAIEMGNATAMRWSDYIDIRTGAHAEPRFSDRADAIAPIDDTERASVTEWAALRKRHREPGRFFFIDLPHRTQGLNMCAPTAAAIAMSTREKPVDPYTVKAKCTGSPTGTGTDWALLAEAIRRFDRAAEIVTFEHNNAGFDEATAALKAELDAGRPALIDVIEPSREAKSAHTVVAVGYDKDAGTWILHDPAEGPPGLWIVTDARLKEVWHSRWWTKTSTGYARPMITIRR